MARYLLAGVIILAGLFFRFHHISDNQFLFYDEGMYIGYNRAFLDLVAHNPAHNIQEFGIILSLMLKAALNTAKALWFFMLNLRVFFLGTEAWYFARWISAASGLATAVLLFFWARRFFNQRVAVLSALILLILPSHVFYSRLGMQEAFSTLLFLGGIYLYMLQDRIRWRFVLSALLLVCVYLTNYRMIIAPIFIAFMEAYGAFTLSRTFNWQKVVVYFAIFYGLVLLVGSLYGGVNLYVNTAWMFHQAQDAGGKFNLINFVSYPYYVFALEGFFFAFLFWLNIYLFKYKEHGKLLPFGLVVLQMAIFSFAAEKGARYLCVVLPFMAAAAAIVVDDAWKRFAGLRVWLLSISVLAAGGMLFLSAQIAMARTDYQKPIDLVLEHEPQAVIVTTQPTIEGLFMPDEKRIVACPHDLASLVALYQKGARYLILDPQAYISWTADGRRFSPPLVDFLQMTLDHVPPLAVFGHINDNILLKRLVLDHNEQIVDSIKFLSMAQARQYGTIRVYDLGTVFAIIKKFWETK